MKDTKKDIALQPSFYADLNQPYAQPYTKRKTEAIQGRLFYSDEFSQVDNWLPILDRCIYPITGLRFVRRYATDRKTNFGSAIIRFQRQGS